MKSILTSLALAFMFATGSAFADGGHSGKGYSSEDGSGCGYYYKKKWEET